MSEPRTNKESFLKEVAQHRLKVLRDDGVYRHLSFRRPGEHSWHLWFELVTWPGSLVINGDMGTWTFSRIEDMFDFFRDGDLRINPQYWQEKCLSVDRHISPRFFCAETFRQAIAESLDNYDLEPDRKAEILEALRDEACHHEDEYPLREAVASFKDGDFELSDTFEISGRRWSEQFLWCLYAIVWGVQQYDAAKKEAA